MLRHYCPEPAQKEKLPDRLVPLVWKPTENWNVKAGRVPGSDQNLGLMTSLRFALNSRCERLGALVIQRMGHPHSASKFLKIFMHKLDSHRALTHRRSDALG